ncbi:MAG: hypothetical protein KGJ90_04890 [Patescibacteria group bacterium]|nr:hypothetical protein [Patescibacteria group bacterium]
MIKNLCLITYSWEGAGIAKRFKDSIGEGGRVLVGLIENNSDILLPSEKSAMENEGKDPNEEEGRNERLNVMKGILDVRTAQSVVDYLRTVEDKGEWFVFCDMNYTFKYATMLSEFMPHGNFPTAFHRELEVDRNKAKEFIEENYPHVNKGKHVEFKDVASAKKFLEKADEVYVLKGDGMDAPTVVPPTDEVDAARQLLLDSLDKNAESYSAGIVLEVKLSDLIELTPEKVFYDGKPLYASLDLENKKKYAGDVGGELTGCSQDLVFETSFNDKINKIAFPSAVDELAWKAKGLLFWDLSLLVSKRTGKIYPGEFCSNRPGWNAFLTEVDGLDIVNYFNDVVAGINPWDKPRFSASVRIFNDSEEKDVAIICPPEIEEHVALMDAKMKDGKLVTVGYMADVAIVTGSGDTMEEAAGNCYDNAKQFLLSTKKWGYRHKGDFLDTSYPTAIPNRLDYAKEHELI